MSTSPQDVLNDIDNITAQATQLDQTLGKGDALSYADGLKIAVAGTTITYSLNQATTHANSLPPVISEADGESIANKLDQQLIPAALSCLQKIQVLRPHADTLVIGGLGKMVLQQMGASAAALAAAGVSHAPTDALKAKGVEMQSTINGAFSQAIQVYSGATGGENEAPVVENQAEGLVQQGAGALNALGL